MGFLHLWVSLAFYLVVIVAAATSPRLLTTAAGTPPVWARRPARAASSNIVELSGRGSAGLIFGAARMFGVVFAATSVVFVLLLRRIPLLGAEGSGRVRTGNYTLD